MSESGQTGRGGQSGETAIIQRYFAPLASGVPGAFGLIDDAGQLASPDARDLVLTTDMIVAGQHYPEDARSQDIGFKALAVNVSDLVAKGADPLVYLLSLALPAKPGADWLTGLSEGLKDAQSAFGCAMLGGDTTATTGPAVISVTAVGTVNPGHMLKRSGANPGDWIYVTGTIGDAALGLRLVLDDDGSPGESLTDDQASFLRSRYWRPRPRTEAIPALQDCVSGAMDVSDGLAGDFAKLCAASGAGGAIRAESVPLSDSARAWLSTDPSSLETVLTGGDDYEVLASVPEDRAAAFEQGMQAAGVPVTAIGQVLAPDAGIKVLGKDGAAMQFARASFDHF